MRRRSFAVIGAGLAGSATAWELARRGHAVTLLEQAEPAHAGGSSHGSARILRYAYSDPFYAGLVVQAREAWRELEELSGVDLLTTTGALDFGRGRNLQELAEVFATVGVEHELLPAEAATERWPGIGFDSPVLWHPAAGVVDAHSAVLAMVALAAAAGTTVLTGCAASAIERTGGGFVVRSDGNDVYVENVVVAAGAWLPLLLQNLPLPRALLSRLPALDVRQVQAFHFPYQPGTGVSWPAFIHKTSALQTYGLPGGRDAGFAGQKVAQYDGGRAIASGADNDGLVDPANREKMTAYVEQYFPGLVPAPYSEAACLFTSTPTEDFIIESVDGVTIVSPCSGHGAKFAPLTGRIAADAATGDHPVPQRFAAMMSAQVRF